MEKFDYLALKEKLVPIITKFGTTVTLTKGIDSELWKRTYDAGEMKFYWVNTVTGERVADEDLDGETTHQGLAVITRYEDEDIDGSLISQRDRRILILAKDFPQPSESESLEIAGDTYTVINSRATKPAGIDVIYVVQARI